MTQSFKKIIEKIARSHTTVLSIIGVTVLRVAHEEECARDQKQHSTSTKATKSWC